MRAARQRFFVVWIVVVWAALALVSLVSAEPTSSLKPSGYVNDFAHVLSPAAVAQMTEIATQLDQKAQAQVVVVTVNTLEGDSVEDYAVELYKRWGIGNKKTDKGVLILYAIQDRRGRVEVGYGLEPILPDGKTGGFQREANPLIKNGDYSGGLLLLTNRIADVIARDAGIQITTSQPRPIEPLTSSPHETELSPGAIIAIIIVIIIVLVVPPLRRLLFYMFLFGGGGGGGYRGGGGWGGGGFGGGGGGFGGFGGGSSGGGGSSTGW